MKLISKFILPNKEFFIGFILTLSLLWPLFAAPYFSHHDDVQVIRLFEMDKCFKDHQIPCRWVPDLGGLYGYPIFNYYAPLPYYFGEFIYFFIQNFILTAKVMFAVSFVGSYIFMYLLAKKFWGKIGGSVSASFYAFAPYHALDFYIRGAMGEMWGMMFFPAVFWAMVKLEEKVNITHLLVLGIFLAGLITSHNLSAMIFLPFSLLWIILLFLKKRNKKFIGYFFLSLFLAICLSAFYFFPMLFEKDLVHVETTTYGYFSYTEHFKGLRKLLGRSWEYGSSIREVPGGEKDKLSYQIGWVHLFGWILTLASLIFFFKRNKFISAIIVFCSFSALISILMIHPRSEFIWKSIASLKYLQFPWRFLILVVFFVSFLSGGNYWLQNKKLNKKIWLFLMLLVVVLNFQYFKPEKFIQINDKDYLSGQNWDKIIKRSIFDYLPIFAKEPPAELATVRYEILTGESKVYDFKEGTNWFNFKTETQTHTIIRLSQYYFPNWKIFVDGKEIKIEYKNNSLGLMTIILGKGNHIVEAKLYDTQIRILANYLTFAASFLLLLLFVSQMPGVKKWFLYYRKRIN